MGQTLSEPITTKDTTEGGDARVRYGASSMQGWRHTMEDAHTTIAEYKDTGASFFAVFDGHGGSLVAKYSGKRLHNLVFESEYFRKGDIREALRTSYLGIDEALRADPNNEDDMSGCTAVAALLTKDNILFVSNAGDSRAILSTNGQAIGLSEDHTPVNEEETLRIIKAGGYVEFGRVNGTLALSRALGDFQFKTNPHMEAEDQVVTANPDVTKHPLEPDNEFAVIACDGMTNQQVADYVRAKITQKVPLPTISENLMDKCLADHTDYGGVGCDNMTVIIVAFLQGKTLDEWYEWVSKKTVQHTSTLLKEDGNTGSKNNDKGDKERVSKKARQDTDSVQK